MIPRLKPAWRAELEARLAAVPSPSRAERVTIVEQAMLLLESIYVHLPLKRAMFAVDPVQRLRTMRYALSTAAPLSSALEFHDQMVRVFASVCDFHTTYFAPSSIGGLAVCLPIVIEPFEEQGARRFIVTATSRDVAVPLERGDEILLWNNTPVSTLVQRRAEAKPGANPATRHDLAVNSLTIRWLMFEPPPDEECVELRYRRGNRIDTVRLDWRLVQSADADRLFEAALSAREPLPRSIDLRGEAIRLVKIAQFAGGTVDADPVEPVAPPKGFESALRAGQVRHTDVGYLRIFGFGGDANGAPFLDAVARLVHALDVRRLIIDVRSNAGGFIPTAERLLQCFVKSGTTFEAQRAQFLSSAVTFEYARRLSDPRKAGTTATDFSVWLESLRQAPDIGASHSRGFPLVLANARSGSPFTFDGSVVLVVDAATRSAAEVFAAGFQDHGVGPVLGTSETTGGAGAEFVGHGTIVDDFATHPGNGIAPFVGLPGGVGMTTALRRMIRVRDRADVLLEGFGVEPDYRCQTTRDDLLHRNRDLIAKAIRTLDHWEKHGPRRPGEPTRDANAP